MPRICRCSSGYSPLIFWRSSIRFTRSWLRCASAAGAGWLPGAGAYCASKAALITYCESLRVELHGSGVRVVTIAPGFIDTPMTAGNPYPMPFLMTAESFARLAVKAILRGDAYQVIPWQMAWLARVLRVLPNRVFDRIMQGRARKPRIGSSA